jgi:uncharacterized membrane protein
MNKKSRLLQWFITILLVSAPAAAYSIGSVQVVDILFNDQSVNETVAMTITGNNNSVFSFSLPEGARDVFVNDVYFNSSTTLEIPLNCTKCSLKVGYALDSVVEKETSHFIFSRTLNFPVSPSSLDYRIKIPSGYTVDLTGNQSDPAIVPAPTGVITDGKNFIVLWQDSMPELPMRYFVRFAKGTPQGADAGFFSFPVIATLLLFLLLGAVGGYYLRGKLLPPAEGNTPDVQPPKAQNPPQSSQAVPEMLLSPDEKTILKLLIANQNEMNQKDVVITLGWSKSKVSAIMSNLEYKTIIQREKFGRNFKVRLVREIAWV